VIVYLVFLNKMSVAVVLAQDAPPQTEDQREARQALNQGVQSFKNGQYGEAVAAFLRARQLDPRSVNARLYLATVYASQYIPGAPGEENQELGRKAVEEFRGVLEMDPQNLSAIDGMGSILFQMSGTPYDPTKFEESKSFHQRHIQIKPNDPEPYYWVGVIDWICPSGQTTSCGRATIRRIWRTRSKPRSHPRPMFGRNTSVTMGGSLMKGSNR